jgi:uncharacterized coiled-coil protein SlyX
MLIALGFLAACLLGLLVAPAFWSRAVRLTTRRIKDTMPLSELEIEADRDRIRAEYAIKMHKLESLVEQVKLAGARQQIEINRRDARVNMLEADLERLRASNEEAQNARRVLEQTIADRLPRVESRLTEAKQVLFAREREVNELTRTSEQQVRALADASAENAQQQREIERLHVSLSQRAAKGAGGADSGLRAELDALKSKTKDQAQIIARLQQLSGHPASSFVVTGSEASPSEAGAGNREGAQASALAQQADLEKQVRTLRARNDDQAAEIARLKAAIAVFEREAESDGKGSIRESRIALKARVQSLEAQATQQSDTVSKLRGELAMANERLARQAAHFTSELKRLGTGAGGSQVRRPAAAARTTLADRVAQARASIMDQSGGGAGAADSSPAGPATTDAATPEIGEIAAGREADREAAAVVAASDVESAGAEATAATVEGAPTVSESAGKKAESKREVAAASAGVRPKLLDRIAGLSRTS